MAKKKEENIAVGFCLDESGSMSSVWDATISGFNEYVDDLRKQQGETLLSLTMFSSYRVDEAPYRPFCEALDIKKVAKLTTENYKPNGNTPLFDAVGHTINKLEAQLAAIPKKDKPGQVLFVIQTDGHENASKEYSRQAVVELIKRKEGDGWKIIFLGANMDEATAARSSSAMGMSVGASLSYDYDQTRATFDSAAKVTRGMRVNSSLSSAELANKIRDDIDKEKKPSSVKEPTKKR